MAIQSSNGTFEDAWGYRLRRHELLGAYDASSETVLCSKDLLGKTDTTLGHELSHHTMLLGTPYGTLLRYLDTARFDLLRYFFNNLYESKRSPPIDLPLSTFVAELSSRSTISEQALRPFYDQDYIVRLRNALEGVKQYPIEAIEPSLRTLFSLNSEIVTALNLPAIPIPLRELPKDLDKAMFGSSTSPVCFGSPLGGLHILESIAWVTELIEAGSNVILPGRKQTILLDGKPIDVSITYHTAFTFFLKQLMGADSELINATIENQFFATNIAFGFLCAAHLALFMPIHPGFWPLFGKADSWYDLHPGWRFVRICEAAADIKLFLVKKDLSNYESIQNAACGLFDWPKPAEFRQLCNSLPLLDMEEETPYAKEFTRACRFLLETKNHPWWPVFPASTYRYAKKPPKSTQILVVNEYRPTVITGNMGVIVGTRFRNEPSCFYRMFKEYSSIMINPDLYKIFGVDQPDEKIHAAEYALMSYIVRAWWDFIMTDETCDLSSFFQQCFPVEHKWCEWQYRLVLLLEIATQMFCCCSLTQMKAKKTNRQVVERILCVPPVMPEKQLLVFLEVLRRHAYKHKYNIDELIYYS